MMKKIILLRHGKPRTSSAAKLTGSSFKQWIDAYNSAPIAAKSTVPLKSKAIVESSHLIVCSTLRRSKESAQLLRSDFTPKSDSMFCEAELPYFNLLKLKLPPTAWLVIFRLAWFLGYSPNAEPKYILKKRAKKCTQRLIELSTEQETTPETTKETTIAFIGHGILNRFIAKELRKQGWYGPKSPASKYWQYSEYQR